MSLTKEHSILASDTYEKLCSKMVTITKDEVIKSLYDTLILYDSREQIIENSLDGIFISDGNGVTLQVNRAYEKIIGVGREELVGLPLTEYLKREYISKSCTLIVMKTKQPTTIESFFYRTGKSCLVTCNPILDLNGDISIIVSNVRDLTEINKLKEQISIKDETVQKYKAEIEAIKRQLFNKAEIIAHDEVSLKTLRYAQKIAKVDFTVLLTGETGVGKEEIAKYIHENSQRNDGHFVKINCGAISQGLFESELFGYEKGAFTGANSDGKIGLFELADKGTLFLDEIGEMPLDMQAKLLRALQDQEIIRVGGVRAVKVDVRVISATNRSLQDMVAEKKFREDLYYRLNVVPIHISPLRERRDDIIPLAEHFLKAVNHKYGYNKTFSDLSVSAMIQYDWPGNVRELRNVIQRAVIMSDSDEIKLNDFNILKNSISEPNLLEETVNISDMLEKLEYSYMEKAYQKHGNVREAARHLCMKKTTFASKYRFYQDRFKNDKS